jgi:hypothetical protein
MAVRAKPPAPLPHAAEATALFRKLTAKEEVSGDLLTLEALCARLQRFGVSEERSARLFELLRLSCPAAATTGIRQDGFVAGFAHYVAVVAEHTCAPSWDPRDTTVAQLPRECLAAVLSHLGRPAGSTTLKVRDLRSCAASCVALRRAACDDSVWAPIFGRGCAWRSPAAQQLAAAAAAGEPCAAAVAELGRHRRHQRLAAAGGPPLLPPPPPPRWSSWRECYHGCLRRESCVLVEIGRRAVRVGTIAATHSPPLPEAAGGVVSACHPGSKHHATTTTAATAATAGSTLHCCGGRDNLRSYQQLVCAHPQDWLTDG